MSFDESGLRGGIRIQVARVGEHWVRVYADAQVVSHECVLPARRSLDGLHPQFVRQMGPFTVYSIDEPSAAQMAQGPEEDAWVQVDITDPTSSELFPGVNPIAAEYASKRALDWSPDIREPARTKIRKIIIQSFGKKTALSQVVDAIREAGAFSEARAKLIAVTEIAQSQVGGNFELMKRSGVVAKVKWVAFAPDPCPICLKNNDAVRVFGAKFPSGQVMPLAHPACQCGIIAVFD